MIDFRRDNYTTPYPYLISKNIVEYDIQKANANILLYKGKIDEEEYNKVLSMDRTHRQIYMGLKQRDKEISEALKEGFAEFREKFIIFNNLTEENIVSIKKDAIFVSNARIKQTKFDNINFAIKNVYSSYYRIGGLEIFYLLDKVNDLEKIDVKGINDNILPLHQNGMILLLCTIFEMIQSNDIKDVIEYLSVFSQKYTNRELPIDYYREFNHDSCYRITMNGCNYITPFCIDSEIRYLNISYNYSFITELYKIVTSIYYQNIKK